MNSDLMNAVLSMDAYNRNSSVGMMVPGSSIGNYTVLNVALPNGSDEISFSASAYLNIDGSTVISYRGTDAPLDDLPSWGIGAGVPFGSQFSAAIAFYNSVKAHLETAGGESGSNINPDDISLTGHSLGGGLAGVVGAFFNKSAELFANMPFEAAVNNAYGYIAALDQPLDISNPYSEELYSNQDIYDAAVAARNLIYGGQNSVNPPVVATNIHGYAVDGEALTDLRYLQSTTVEGLISGASNFYQVDPLERHSMSMHTLLMWEKDHISNGDNWRNIANNLWDTYNDNDIAAAIGFNSLGSGLVDHSQKMTVAASAMAEKNVVGHRS